MKALRAALVTLVTASLVAPSVGAQPKDAPPPAKDAAPPAEPAPTKGEAAEGAAPKEVDPAARTQAETHFKKGLELLQEEAWAAALAEFLRSRELFPTRTATNNAAVCLRKLKRFDESLDMYATLLREFPNMPEDRKVAAQKEISELQR